MHEGLLELNLAEEASVDLWRFVTFDRRLPGWKPDRLLTIAPLSDHLEIAQEIPFWKGARQELIDYHERLRKSAEAAARREERQRHGQQPQAKRPRAAAKPRSAQAAAAKAARARDPEHQALLAVCDVELPSASDFSQGDGDAWGELVAEVAEVSDGSESDELFGKDPALDTPLAALLRTEDADIVAADPGVNSDQTDSLFGPSSEEDVPKPMQTTLKVRAQAGTTPDKGGEDREGSAPVSLLQGESSSQSSSTSSSSSSTAISGSSSEGSPADASGKKHRQTGPRGKRSGTAEAPPGCSLARYHPEDGTPFWFAKLPKGVSDRKGWRTRRRSFREGLRTESQAKAQCEIWLQTSMEEQVAEDSDNEHEAAPSE